MIHLLTNNLTNTHPLIQTTNISNRGADSEIILRAQNPLLTDEQNCVVYMFIDTAPSLLQLECLIWSDYIGKCHNLLLSLKLGHVSKI